MLNTHSLQNQYNENLKEIKRIEQHIANNLIDLYDSESQRSLSSDLNSFLLLQKNKLLQHPLILKTIHQLQKQLNNIDFDNSILKNQLQQLNEQNSEIKIHLQNSHTVPA